MLTRQQRLAGLTPELASHTVAAAKILQAGRLKEADGATQSLLERVPQHPELLRLLGTIRLMQQRHDEAAEALTESLRIRPQDVHALRALSRVYEAQQDLFNALGAARRACELAEDDPLSWFSLGRLLYRMGDLDPAEAALRRALASSPGLVQAQVMLANIANANGHPGEAEKEFRRILDVHPALGTAWWSLALLKPDVFGAGDIERMRGQLDQQGLGASDRVAIGFALAHALEHAGDYDAAFAALRESNDLARREYNWNVDEFRNRQEALRRVFDSGTAMADRDQGEEVIFIVGMPRSGTTLIEQILASHSQVQGTTELQDALQVIMEESNRVQRPFPEWVNSHSAAEWTALGERYLALTERWRRDRPRFTDKAPGNWHYLGAILAMLPRTRVVVIRRDPLETCLSCYRHQLAGHPYTYDLGHLASFWREFDETTRIWKQRHPQNVREQSYEALQSDPEGQIRELLEFCDLPFESGCQEFHRNTRRVTTVSAGQVRKPIRADTAIANKYGASLDPLRTALGLLPFADADSARRSPLK